MKFNIEHVLTPANRSELHGIAERWNRTVMTMANAMMFRARISPVLWSSAIAHANCIRNRLPSRSRAGHTPYELFTNRLPRYDNFRIWGCYCYKLLPSYDKVPGLPVRKRLIYVGDSASRIGFRCFDPIEFKFTTEYELIFDEDGVDKRSSLLEAFDKRRKQIKEGNIDKVPLVSESNPNMNERTVYMPTSPQVEGSPTSGLCTPTSAELMPVGTPLVPVASRQEVSCDDPVGQDASVDAVTGKECSSSVSSKSLSARSKVKKCNQTPVLTGDTQQSAPSVTSTSSLNYGKEVLDSGQDIPMRRNQSTCDFGQSTPVVKPRRSRRVSAKKDKPVKEAPTAPAASALKVDAQPFVPSSIEATASAAPFDPAYIEKHLQGDEFNIVLSPEAESHGPLSKVYIDRELAKFSFDLTPSHPKCSQRYLPVGREEPKSQDMDKFIQLAKTKNLPIKILQSNPKLPRSASYIRYEVSKSATSIREYHRLLADHGLDKPYGNPDFKNDVLHGYITFPQHTHCSDESDHDFACICIQTSVDEVPSDAFAGTTISGDTFQDVVKAMWPDDPSPSLAEERSRESQAHAIVSALTTGKAEPSNYKAAVKSDNPEREQWLAAIDKELNTLSQRNTWSYVPRSTLGAHKYPIRCKYVFKKKLIKSGDIQFKARLVACGYSQKAGLDYASDELYASVCSYASMRFMMSLATQKGLSLYQTDIQGAYLESYLNDELYMDVPQPLPNKNEAGHPLVCKLHRGLYGLKQSGFAWSQCFKEFMLNDHDHNMGFSAMTGESNLYRKVFELNGKQQEIIVGQYVDDCLVATSSDEALQWFLKGLNKRFPVNPNSSGYISKDDPGFILSMHVHYDVGKGVLRLNQLKSIEALAAKFKLNDPKLCRSLPLAAADDLPKLSSSEAAAEGVSAKDYLSIVGSCLHIAQVSRPDIAYAVGVLARHSTTAGKVHMTAALDLVKYLYSSRHWSIQYTRSSHGNDPIIQEGTFCPEDTDFNRLSDPPARTIEERLVPDVPTPTPNNPDTYVDANLGGERFTRKSTSGMVIMMNGGPIDWCSRLQKLCAQSSAEAEIYAVTDSVKQALHIRLLCEEAGIRTPDMPMTVWEDNQACIQMGHNLRGSNNAKHFELRLRFLNEHIWLKNIEFSKIDTKDQLADGFTKSLPRPAFEKFRSSVLVDTSPQC